MEKGGLNNSTQNQVEMRLICSNCLQFFQTVSAFGIVWLLCVLLTSWKRSSCFRLCSDTVIMERFQALNSYILPFSMSTFKLTFSTICNTQKPRCRVLTKQPIQPMRRQSSDVL